LNDERALKLRIVMRMFRPSQTWRRPTLPSLET
jgi:hypothetical protein